jgi:5'-3' exoribonuclease 2
VRGVVASYIEGLVWVMRYYYDGVASWNWCGKLCEQWLVW